MFEISIIGCILICLTFITFTKNPLFTVLGLVLVFINSAILLIATGFHFLGLVYLVVYVGAICVLFLFAIMILNLRQYDLASKKPSIFFASGVVIISILAGVDLQSGWIESTRLLDAVPQEKLLLPLTETAAIAQNLYESPLTFIIIAMILFIGIVACIGISATPDPLTSKGTATKQ